MASSGASGHLPALGDCLDGSKQLMSWKDAFLCIRDGIHLTVDDPVHQFLADPETLKYFAQLDQPFPPEAPEAKTSFERLTSAINAPSSASGSYDVKQIKEDALWLSKEAGIGQVVALRLAVLEVQQQPEDCILKSIQGDDGDGGLSFQKSALLRSVLGQHQRESSTDSYNTPLARRIRLLSLLVTEKGYAVKCRELIAYTGLSKADAGPNWLTELGRQIVGQWIGSVGRPVDSVILRLLEAIEQRIEKLRSGFPWLREEESPDVGLTALWYSITCNELVHDFELLLHLIQSKDEALSLNVVKAWFMFMDKTLFFSQSDNLDLKFNASQTQAVQSLTALVSAAVLQPGLSVGSLQELAIEGAAQTPTSGSYLRDPGCVELITLLMVHAGRSLLIPAGPAMLAWAVILFNLRYMARAASDNREVRSAQRAIEFTHSADSDNDSVDSINLQTSRDNRRLSFGSDGGQPMTLLETVWDAAARAIPPDDAGDKQFGETLLEVAYNDLSAFSVISQIANDFCGPYGSAFDGLFDVESRLVLFDVLRTTVGNLPYDPDLIEAMVTVLGGNQKAEDQHHQCNKFPEIHPVNRLWNDEKSKHQFLDMARSRFPWEAGPFLALCQCLASVRNPPSADIPLVVLEYIRTLPTITTILYDASSHYTLPSDDDQGNVRLDADIEILPHVLDLNRAENSRLSRRLLGQQKSEHPYFLRAGSSGQCLTDDKPLIVMWNFGYSGPAFVGVLLQVAAELWLGEKSAQLLPAHANIINGSLGLITRLLESSDSAEGERILGDFSDDLGDGADIIQVVLDIFESLMYRSVIDPIVSGLLVTCADLVRQFVLVMPGRVWPFMGRSGLLGIDKTDSRLRVILAANEIPSGQFGFLLSSVKLFEALIEDAVRNCLKRKSPSKAVTRFQQHQVSAAGLGVSEASEKRILGQFQTLLIDIFESSMNWRFQNIHEKTQLITTLLRTMDDIIVYYNDVDDANDDNPKLVSFLSTAFSQIASSFLINSQNNAACHALFSLLEDSVQTPLGSFTTRTPRAWLYQSIMVLRVATRLVRLRVSLSQPPGVLEAGLLKLVPTLVKIYTLHPELRLPVVVLLRELVVAASRLDSPPSILSHLSTDTAKNFVKSLKKFGKPNNNSELGIAIWKFLTAVVSMQQRWFSIVLLTGSTPRDALKDKCDDRASKAVGSLLSLATTEICDLTSLDSAYATSLLEFLAQASDFWPWVAEKLRKDKRTWDSLLQFLVALKTERKDSKPVHTAQQVQMAAYILDIAAVLVHQNAANGDNTFAKSLGEKLAYLFEHGVSSPEYNRTLHIRLESNFTERYQGTGCKLVNFKRSSRAESRFGDAFYYDIDFASKLLSFDEAWNREGERGYSANLRLANKNLSLVEAQIRLFQSWKSLCAELTIVLVDDIIFSEKMLQVAGDCVQENLENALPLNLFERLSQSRMELAFTVMQSVIPRIKRSETTEQVLTHTWDLVREPFSELSLALTGESADYHRTCMRVLYLALQPHVQDPALHASRMRYSSTLSKPVGPDVTLLEILRTVVAHGFQSLVTLLHDDAAKVLPSDFALLQAILHTILQSPDLERHQESLLNIFSDAKTPTYASTLFSWADRVLVDGDPIYGEVSINILLELSAFVPLAEAIVTSGALSQVATSSLARVYGKGVGQFDQPTRLYSIWTRGILPLTVNLLAAIGPLIGADTANFINQFSGQLDQASTSLDTSTPSVNGFGAGLVTLGMAGEVNMLALISSSLLAFKDAGASAGVIAADISDLAWDRVQVKRDIEDRLSRRAALRDSIVPTNEREEQWLRQTTKESSLKAENLLEEKIVGLLTSALEMLGPAEV